MNDIQCSPDPILHVQHASNNGTSRVDSDTHGPRTVVGICEGVPAGNVRLQVYSKMRDGHEDCYRGHALTLAPSGDADDYPAIILLEEIP